jgi:hypothetical protein
MFFSGRVANGGGVIFWRSVWITVLFLLPLGLWLQSVAKAGCPKCHPAPGVLLEIAKTTDTVPWLGAIFAAVWAALYARFASQWTYLAGVYNQMREAQATRLRELQPDANEHLLLWRAGFVEDALDLHLATKPIFGTFIQRLLQYPEIVARFDEYSDGGQQKRRERLEKQLRKRFGDLTDKALAWFNDASRSSAQKATALRNRDVPASVIDVLGQLDRWWKRWEGKTFRDDKTFRDALIEQRAEELGAEYEQIVLDANEDDPRKPPPIVAIVTDQTTGRFRLPPILAVYLELKAREEPD